MVQDQSMNYVYVITGIPSDAPMGNPQYATRHEAAGEKAIIDAIHGVETEIVARKRLATDPVSVR